MSRISSLGIHTPAALPYCLSENLLSDPIPPNSYTWTTTPFLPNEELLVTSTAVIWSQGGVIRRVFRFEVEKQPVIQAVLTWFPSEDPADLLPFRDEFEEGVERTGYQGGPGNEAKRKKDDGEVGGRQGVGAAKKRMSSWNAKSRTYATQLGSFPKAKMFQQHMFGGAGNYSDEEEDTTPLGRARTLVVFLKTQAHVYFLSGKSYVIHVPFEIQHALPSVRGLLLQVKVPSINDPLASQFSFSTNATFGDSFNFNIPPPMPIDSAAPDVPRLYSLTDPLLDLGMVITGSGSPLEADEELIFISPNSELDQLQHNLDPTGAKSYLSTEVVFAVTRNQEKSQITVWFVRYIPQEAPSLHHKRSSSGTATARRRSSFGPVTGTTTPVAGGGPGAIPLSTSQQTAEDVVLEFDGNRSKRNSRRISSLVARADLSQNVDRIAFSDMASAGSSFQQEKVGGHREAPEDGLLNDLNMASLGLGFGNMGIHDGTRLRNEVLMTKLESFPFQCTGEDTEMKVDVEQSWAGGDSPGTVSGGGIAKLPRVFTLLAPPSVIARETNTYGHGAPKVVLCIVNKKDSSLLQLTFLLQTHTIASSATQGYTSAANYAKRRTSGKGDSKLYTPVLTDIVRHQNVADAIKIEDGGVSRILVLSAITGELSLCSPWSPEIPVVLPPTLARWSPNTIGGSMRKKKGGFARTLSTSPERYIAFEYTEEGGRVSILDENRIGHRIGIQLAPREQVVKLALNCVMIILGAVAGVSVGETVGSVWMEVSRSGMGMYEDKFTKRRSGSTPSGGGGTEEHNWTVGEWEAFVISIFCLGITSLEEKPKEKPKRRVGGLTRSASLVANTEWEEMLNNEAEWGAGAEYLRSPAWSWMVEEQEESKGRKDPYSAQLSSPSAKNRSQLQAPTGRKRNTFIVDCGQRAREFLSSPAGKRLLDHLPIRSRDSEVRRTSLAMVLVALHLLREELKLDITMELAVRRMTPLLAQLARWLGWKSWVNDYTVEDMEIESWAYDDSRIPPTEIPQEPFSAPSIYAWLLGCLERTTQTPFLSLQDIVSPSPASPVAHHRARSTQNFFSQSSMSTTLGPPSINLSKQIYAKLTPRTKAVTELYAMLTTPGKTHVDVVSLMVKQNVTAPSLERIPEGVVIPLREAIARCQEQPPTTWGPTALDLVGRKDLKMLVSPGKIRKEFSKWQGAPTHEATRDVHTICSSTNEAENIGFYDGSAEFDRQAVTRLIFRDDRRIHEAAKLLTSNKPAVAKCIPDPDWSEQEFLDAQKEVTQHVAVRTLAVPPGRGLLYFSSRIPLLTEKYPIMGFNLTCVMKPSNTTVSADKAAFTEDKVCWAFFHAGVASGLSISKEAKEIDTSWIVFNKPSELSNRHAGFLLALGLNGHLKSIAKWHAFNYLTPKHTMTSIGLLLGLSASYLGTMDTTITRLLSIHVMRLLPVGSAELNLSPLTQTAGVMGVGLLYCNTQHRRMSEVMLSEIEYIDHYGDPYVPTDVLRDEGYRLAAGFALGFINLGNGRDLRGLHDMHLVERLLRIAVGSKKVQSVHELDKSTAGAMVALALIYMKSMDESLAKKVDVPDTPHLFDYVRPDIFLLRTVARHLIMWENIQRSMKWVERNVVRFLRERYLLKDIHALDSDDLPLYNIISGLCFSMALKFAGSGDNEAKETILHYLDQFIRICNLPAMNHDQKLARTTARNCQDLLALSASTIMAGTGDLDVFRRLRRLHGRVDPDVPYGSHLAAHTAVGVLFLGAGNYTFGTSSLAIASLFCAFYPLFPTTILDNRSHLQAFRHFWVLAAEARCLVARDVDSHRPITIPIVVWLKDGTEIKKVAPCIVPEVDKIERIITASPAHWTITLDFLNNPDHLATFQANQTIYVHKRSAYASTSTVFQATLQALEEAAESSSLAFASSSPLTSFSSVSATDSLSWLLSLQAFSSLDRSEKALLLPPESSITSAAIASSAGTAAAAAAAAAQPALALTNASWSMDSSIVDTKLMLEKCCLDGVNRDRLWNIKLLFGFVDWLENGGGTASGNGKEGLPGPGQGQESGSDQEGARAAGGRAEHGGERMIYLSGETVDGLKAGVWVRGEMGEKGEQ